MVRLREAGYPAKRLTDDEWTYFGRMPVQRADLAIKQLANTPGMESQWLEAAVTDAFNDVKHFSRPRPGRQITAANHRRWQESARCSGTSPRAFVG